MNDLEEIRDLYPPDSSFTSEVSGRMRGRLDSSFRTAKNNGRRPREWKVRLIVGAAVAGVLAALAVPAVLWQRTLGDNDVRRPDAASPTSAPVDGKTLLGKTYVSSEIARAGKPVELMRDVPITLRFIKGAGGISDRLEARANCNIVNGSPLSTDSGRLQFGKLRFTQMFCKSPRQEQDNWIADFLRKGPSWRLDNGRLILRSGDIRVVLAEPVGTIDPALAGRTFRSIEITEAGKPFDQLAVPITVRFGAGPSLQTWARCQTFSVNKYISTANGRIRIDRMSTDDKRCGEETKMEDAFLGPFFESDPTWRLIDGKLILESGTIRVVLAQVAK